VAGLIEAVQPHPVNSLRTYVSCSTKLQPLRSSATMARMRVVAFKYAGCREPARMLASLIA
jgi:hypothetical protein